MAKKEKELHLQLYPGWSARDNYASHTKKKKRKKEVPQQATSHVDKGMRSDRQYWTDSSLGKYCTHTHMSTHLHLHASGPCPFKELRKTSCHELTVPIKSASMFVRHDLQMYADSVAPDQLAYQRTMKFLIRLHFSR